MRFKLIAVLLTGLALAACETTGDETATTDTSGDATPTEVAATPTETRSATPAPTGVGAGTYEDFVNIGDRVFFDYDRYELKSESRETLERQAIWLKQYPSVVISIEGHADERGTREYNLALGERRASSVKNYLVALGVDPRRVKVISYGKERPFDPRSNDEAWAINRRGVTSPDRSTLVSSN